MNSDCVVLSNLLAAQTDAPAGDWVGYIPGSRLWYLSSGLAQQLATEQVVSTRLLAMNHAHPGAPDVFLRLSQAMESRPSGEMHMRLMAADRERATYVRWERNVSAGCESCREYGRACPGFTVLVPSDKPMPSMAFAGGRPVDPKRLIELYADVSNKHRKRRGVIGRSHNVAALGILLGVPAVTMMVLIPPLLLLAIPVVLFVGLGWVMHNWVMHETRHARRFYRRHGRDVTTGHNQLLTPWK